MPVKRILVTGGSGDLGRVLCERAVAAGYDVTATYLNHPEYVRAGQPIRLDLSDAAAVQALLDRTNPAAIIHTALNQNVPNPVLHIVEAAKNLYTLRHPDTRLIVMSSDMVFDGTAAPYAEEAVPAPLAPYGRGKAESEQYGDLVVRTSLIYDFESPNKQIDWLIASINRGQKCRLFSDEFRSPIWVVTLADALIELIDSDIHGVLNIAGPQVLSRLELGWNLLEALGYDPEPFIEVASQAGLGRPPNLTLNVSRALRLLRTPLLTIDEARAAWLYRKASHQPPSAVSGRPTAMKIETLAIHAGRKPDPATGAIAEPIYLSTTFERAADGTFPHGYVYTRSENPNRAALEACLQALEGGTTAVAFSSGLAAAASILQALPQGSHVIAPNDSYMGTKNLLRQITTLRGLDVSFVNMTDLDAVRAAIQPDTQMIWTETPSNPLLKITDLTRVAEIAHSINALCVCDSTWCTPVIQRPFTFGVDVVVHATTKYFGGHTDVLGGAIIFRQGNEFSALVRQIQVTLGAVPSPFDCWLILRGTATLPWRMRGHSENAMRLATFLKQHPRVMAVHYPGLPDHPGHAIAARQMSMFGGMLSFEVQGGQAAAMAVAARVTLFTRATSLGGVESLIEHRASIEGPGTLTPDSLLRVSVGLEHPDDLIADLEQALAFT
ncbi:MAG: aminotransferase class I/II-fold pyridoxal phosphate-dependent enzyme [Anaerolineae bacterium]|nr:aminotransferase class I/II-fold pyridoxal phosphate-dependent enzyme [Anaerolineae bacterium]